ncbi:hypothetical protein CEXT_658201 [Caerostris extrusa]|uniref:Uncharacterized protein n=1 Tax=Caerostris extrusa TaxID=172846 RepID=A0AAV4S4H6_CAEEX|nr:hypothetical protein CEXT_658201 [Caerostris extrusa]
MPLVRKFVYCSSEKSQSSVLETKSTCHGLNEEGSFIETAFPQHSLYWSELDWSTDWSEKSQSSLQRQSETCDVLNAEGSLIEGININK